MAEFYPGKTYLKFTFKEPMLVSQYWITYRTYERGASDPINWTLKVKSAIFPYQEIEYKYKSQYTGTYSSSSDKPKRGDIEKIIMDDEILTDQITIVFDKIRDHDYESYNRYLTL